MTDYQNEILDLYDDAAGEVEGGRSYKWSPFHSMTEEDLTHQMMGKLRERVHTAFYARHIETGTFIEFYKNFGGHLGLIACLIEAETWLSEQEKKRLAPNNIKRP